MSNMLLSFLPFRAARVVTHTHRLNSQTKSFLERSVSTTCKIEQASDASHFVQVEGPHILGFLGEVGFPSLHSIKQPQTARTCLSDKPWWNTVAGEGVGQNQVSKYRLIREVSIPTSACCSLMVEQPSCSQVAHCTIFSNDSLSDASGDTSVWRTLPGRKESLDPQDPVSKCRLRKKGIAAIPSTRTEIVLHIHLWCTVHGSRPGHGYRNHSCLTNAQRHRVLHRRDQNLSARCSWKR